MDLMSDIRIDSLSVAAELIGPNHDSAAFIYGFMSLLDKLTCGIVVIGIQGVRHNVFRGYLMENFILVQDKNSTILYRVKYRVLQLSRTARVVYSATRAVFPSTLRSCSLFAAVQR